MDTKQATNEGESMNNVPIEAWKKRLQEEFVELHDRVEKLKAAFNNPDMRLSYREWEMLREQLVSMNRYLSALTARCNYYNLIPQEPSRGAVREIGYYPPSYFADNAQQGGE